MNELFNYLIANNLAFTAGFIADHPVFYFLFHVILYGFGLAFILYSILTFIDSMFLSYYKECKKLQQQPKAKKDEKI